MNVRHPMDVLHSHTMGVVHSLSLKNIFYDKTGLRFFYFHVTSYKLVLVNPKNFDKTYVHANDLSQLVA